MLAIWMASFQNYCGWGVGVTHITVLVSSSLILQMLEKVLVSVDAFGWV